MSTMKAVGYKQPGDIVRADSLMDVTLPTPVATGRDLLSRSRPFRSTRLIPRSAPMS